MKIERLLWLPLILLHLTGCRTEIEFNAEEKQAKIVINSVIYVDSLITCYVHRTTFSLEPNRKVTPLPDAQVLLEVDGVVTDTLRYKEKGLFESNTIAARDKIYRFIVSHQGYPTATAQSAIIPETQLISLEKLGEGMNEIGNRTTTFRLKFEKDPDNKGFYYFKPFTKYTFFEWDSLGNVVDTFYHYGFLYVETDRSTGIEFAAYNNISNGNDFGGNVRYYFTDKLTTADNYSMIEFVVESHQEIDFQNFFILVEKVSQDFFLYEQSLAEFYQNDEFLFFTQPVQVFNNVGNGMGIVGTAYRYPLFFLYDNP